MITIHLYIDGREYGMRRWPAVPAKGQLVAIDGLHAIENYIVVDVLWGVTLNSRRLLSGECEVNLYLRKARNRT